MIALLVTLAFLAGIAGGGLVTYAAAWARGSADEFDSLALDHAKNPELVELDLRHRALQIKASKDLEAFNQLTP